MAWTSFLSAAGVIHQRAAVYAKLLMWHGATPSSMWLFTGQDIFQMGICDYRDIRMIQEHAHLLHAMHRSSAMAEDRLGMSGYPGAFDVASAQQDGSRGLGHNTRRRNKRWVRANDHHDQSGFITTSLNLRSAAGESSVKQRLGWHYWRFDTCVVVMHNVTRQKLPDTLIGKVWGSNCDSLFSIKDRLLLVLVLYLWQVKNIKYKWQRHGILGAYLMLCVIFASSIFLWVFQC